MFLFIFDDNYGNLWQISIIFFTTRNRNEYSTKRVQTVLLQREYVPTLRYDLIELVIDAKTMKIDQEMQDLL